jgi:flavin reductase (DIM6/NTAB) family NADH-FMN oxidoreductase RutF
MTDFDKVDFPLMDVRQHLETGPIVLVSAAHRGERDIMTMGWHMMMQFNPALFGCFIWSGNHSYDLIRQSRECVINVPTVDLVDAVVSVGNSSGAEIDKFKEFGLTPESGSHVDAPVIKQCYANFECILHDDRLIDQYSLFVWRVVAAHVAPIKAPKTMHYRGEGTIMVAGEEIVLSERFLPQNL